MSAYKIELLSDVALVDYCTHYVHQFEENTNHTCHTNYLEFKFEFEFGSLV